MVGYYKGNSPTDRIASLRLTKKAIASGEIPKPDKCQLCYATQGRIDYHNETYASPTKGLTMLCRRCHLIWHGRWRNPNAFTKLYIESGLQKRLTNPDMLKVIKKFKPSKNKPKQGRLF